MTASIRLMNLVSCAIVIVGSIGCDAEPLASDESFPELTFREGDKDGTGKVNTSFLGQDEDYPLDNLPLISGGESQVELVEIRATACQNVFGATIFGTFSTAGLGAPVVPLSTNGVLGSLTVADVNQVTSTCVVSGDLWENTYWEVVVDDGNEEIETDLRLTDVALDEHGATAYQWHVNWWRIYGGNPAAGAYQPTCDEDLENPGLDYHGYLLKDRRVDATTGDFSSSSGTMFLACRSGAVGKSIAWGYSPWAFSSAFHETATRMVRADYCGNGTSNTEPGTGIWLDDGELYGKPPEEPYVVEAEWSVTTGAATCVSEPRLPELQEGFQAFVCNGVPLPSCEAANLPPPSITTLIPDPEA